MSVILEVGTGTTALTRELARVVPRLITVEVDAGLHKLASELLKDDKKCAAYPCRYSSDEK